MIEEYIKSRGNLTHVFLLIDYRHKPTEDDILMYNFLKYYRLNVTVVATKYDKVGSSQRINQDKLIMNTLGLEENGFIHFSSTTKKGREEIYKIIKENASLN